MGQTNIVMDLFSFTIIFCVFLFLQITIKKKSPIKKAFAALCIIAMARDLCDALSWKLEGNISNLAYYSNVILITMLTIFTILMLEAFVFCVISFINMPSEKSKKLVKASYIVCGCILVLIFVDLPLHFFYSIDRTTNVYVRANHFWVFIAFTFVLLILCATIIGLEEKNLKKVEKFNFIAYLVLYLIACVLTSVGFEPSLIPLFMAIMIVLIGLRIQFDAYEDSNTERMIANLEVNSLSEIYTGVLRYDRKKNIFVARMANEKYGDYIDDNVFNIRRFIDEVISEEYRKQIDEFLSKEKIDEIYEKNVSVVNELEYLESLYGAWRRMIMIYKAGSSGRQLFLLFHDITQEKELQFSSTEQTRRVINASKDVYADFMEWNVHKNKVIRLKFDKAGIVEVPVEGEFVKAFKRFRDNNVLPEDLEVFSCFSPQKLICLEEGKTITCNFRLRENDEFRYIINPENTKKTKKLGNVADYRWHTVIARKTKNTEDEEIITFLTQDIEDSVKERIALKTISEHDKLTELYNRTKYNAMLETDYAKLASCGVLFFDVNYLKNINDEFGHEAGDILLKMAADSLKYISNDRIHAYRYGGDEMLVVVCNGPFEEMEEIVNKWRSNLDKINETSTIKCSMAVGYAWSNCDIGLNNLVMVADDRMYIDKKRIKEGNKA